MQTRRTSIPFLVALIFASALGVAPGTVQAQEPPMCQPDCFSSPWSGPFSKSVQIPSLHDPSLTCTVDVLYYTRTACPANYTDIGIRKFEFDPADPGCAGMDDPGVSIAAALAMVIEALLKTLASDPTDVEHYVPPGSCATQWRVTHGGCWSKFVPSPGVIRAETCVQQPLPCCLTRYEICHVINPGEGGGTITVTKTLSLPPPVGCDNAEPFEGGVCEPVCD